MFTFYHGGMRYGAYVHLFDGRWQPVKTGWYVPAKADDGKWYEAVVSKIKEFGEYEDDEIEWVFEDSALEQADLPLR